MLSHESYEMKNFVNYYSQCQQCYSHYQIIVNKGTLANIAIIKWLYK